MFRQVSVVDINVGDQEPTFDNPPKSLTTTSSPSHPPHQPLYATLAEYTLNSPRSFPIDTSSSSRDLPSSTFRRPSSPLRPIGEHHIRDQPGPFKEYSFPKHHSPSKENINMTALAPSMSPTSSSTGMPLASSSMTSTAQHRMSVSGRSRRPSPLLHEIQPPSRRLSAHQMLLLTPFGGPLPAGALAGAGGMGMTRGSSSLGQALPTAPARLGSSSGQSSGWPRKDSNGSSGTMTPTNMGRESSSVGRVTTSSAPTMGREPSAAGKFPPRSRHSLAHPTINPSPLASAPMTTIFSQGSSEGASSRGPSAQEMERNTVFMSRDEIGKDVRKKEQIDEDEIMSPPKSRARLLSATVSMSRSNSLPVLTLRELQALKDKDGELGIQRGGDWAWVSRDTDELDEVDMPEVETPSMDTETSTNASTSTSSLVTPLEQPLSASSSSYRNPFTSFHDPFAPRQPGVTPVSAFTPMATSSDYHYAPTGIGAELRRMSDAPPTTSSNAPSPTSRGGRRSVTDSRRPSAPTSLRQSITSLTPKPLQRRTPPQVSQSIFQTGYQPLAAPEETSPHGSPIAGLPPASRPRLLRYKSSPARTTGLGLNIVVRPNNSGRDSGSEQSPGHPGSAGTDSRGSMGEQSGSGAPSRASFTSGRWAEVDFVDSLAAVANVRLNSDPIAPALSTGTGMSRIPSSVSPTAVANRDLSSTSRQSISSVHGPYLGSSSASAISPSRKGSTISSSSNPVPQAQSDISSKYKIQHVSSRSHIVEFDSDPVFKGRSRFESVDSAFPLMPGGNGERLSVPTQGAGETYAHRNSSFSVFENNSNTFGIGAGTGTGTGLPGLSEGFPRRGSLGMGTFAKLRKMIGAASSTGNGNGRNSDVDEMGQRISNTNVSDDNVPVPIPSGHWSERRGSWAEGWSNSNN